MITEIGADHLECAAQVGSPTVANRRAQLFMIEGDDVEISAVDRRRREATPSAA